MGLTLGFAPSRRAEGRWRLAEPTTSACHGSVGVRDRYEAQVQLLPDEDARAAFDRVRSRLLRYDIFPPAFMKFAMYPPGNVTRDGLIVQRVGVGALRLECAVRVVETWDRRDESGADAGFRYATLRGHPEHGTESFRSQLDSHGRVVLTIEACSKPAVVIVRLMRPMARWIQVTATQAALRRLTAS